MDYLLPPLTTIPTGIWKCLLWGVWVPHALVCRCVTVSIICSELQGEIRKAIAFIIRAMGVVLVEVKVKRNVGDGLGLESEEWEFIVRGAQVLGWFKEV